MVDAINAVADAFRADMGGAPANPQNQQRRGAEEIFANSATIDKGGENPSEAGGDSQPVPGEKPQRAKNRREEDEDTYVDPDLEDGEDEEDDTEDGEDEEDDTEDADRDEDDQDPILGRKYDIVVDGEEVTVSLREALKGYSRTGTFHKRMNQLDEVQTTLAAEVQKTIDRQRELAKQFEDFSKEYDSLLPPEPNWDELYKVNPQQARQQEKIYRELKAKVDTFKNKSKEHNDAADRAQAEEFGRFARQEFPKFARIARLKDEKHAERELRAMKKSAMSVGFTEEEFNQAVDSRMLTILWKASRLDRILAEKPREVRTSRTPQDTDGAVRRRNGSAPTGGKGAGNSRSQMPSTAGVHLTSIERAAQVFEQHIKPTPRGRRRA